MAREFGNRGDEYYPAPDVLEKLFEASPHRDVIIGYFKKHDTDIRELFHWPEYRGGLLPDIGILRHLLTGGVHIDPFNIDLLQPNGYDVRLGSMYLKVEENPRQIVHSTLTDLITTDVGYEVVREEEGFKYTPLYFPYSKSAVTSLWSGVAWRAVSVRDLIRQNLEATSKEEALSLQLPLLNFYEQIEDDCIVKGAKELGVTPDEFLLLSPFTGGGLDDEVIVLGEEELILGHSIEKIGGRNVISTRISAKSSVGRHGLRICNDANLGSPGFIWQWVLEVRNEHKNVPIMLVVGTLLGTIQFEEMPEPPLVQYGARGSYVEQIAINGERLLPKPLKWIREQIKAP